MNRKPPDIYYRDHKVSYRAAKIHGRRPSLNWPLWLDEIKDDQVFFVACSGGSN